MVKSQNGTADKAGSKFLERIDEHIAELKKAIRLDKSEDVFHECNCDRCYLTEDGGDWEDKEAEQRYYLERIMENEKLIVRLEEYKLLHKEK